MTQKGSNMDELTELKWLLFKEMPWVDRCEIIPAYMPPFPRPDTRPSVQIRYNSGSGHPPFLRYSCGPLQGYFWDIYGDDFQSVALATIALSRAPPPYSVDPIKFTIPLKSSQSDASGEPKRPCTCIPMCPSDHCETGFCPCCRRNILGYDNSVDVNGENSK